MEARKITIVSTKTQKKSVIMSKAETLGQLKQELRTAGIDFEDMSFYEGTSKTELKTDESVLPKDVPYTNRTTGETKNTNELVFMLTNTNKKIKSGAMTRKEAYTAIKNLNLQKECMITYGKSYTQCSTVDLEALITNVEKSINSCTNVDVQTKKALQYLIDELYCNGCLTFDQVVKVKEYLKTVEELSSSYSSKEIDAMFESML